MNWKDKTEFKDGKLIEGWVINESMYERMIVMEEWKDKR